MTPHSSARSWLLPTVLLLGAVVTAVGAVALTPAQATFTPLWAPAAFTVATLALAPRSRWPALIPAVLVASVLGRVLSDRPMDWSMAFALATVLEAVVGALILTDGGRRRPSLATQDDVLRLLWAAVAASLTFGVAAAALSQVLGINDFLTTFRATSAGHAAALITLLAVAVVFGQPGRWRWSGELVLQLGILLLLTGVVFAPQDTLMVAVPPIVALAWAATRFELRVLVVELAAFAVAVAALTAAGRGPFAAVVSQVEGASPSATGAAQLYLLCTAVITLPLAVSVAQSKVLLARVRADEQLFRRNFTESLVGMAFLAVDEVPGVDESGEVVDGMGIDIRIVDLNDTAATIFGGSREALVDTSVLSHIDLDEEFLEALEQLLAGERDAWQGEYRLVGARPGRIQMAVAPLSDDVGSPLVSAQILDVTSEHEARRSLDIAERLTSTTLDTTASIIIVTDLDGTVIRVNEATSEITGYAAKHLVGRPVWELGLVPSEASDIEALLMWPNRSGVPIAREADALTRSGEKLRIVWNTNIVRDEHDEPAYAVMTGIDVTAERATTGLVNHLMEASHTTALVGFDTRGRITVVNSGTEFLLGYDRNELVGKPFVSLFSSTELLERTGVESTDEAFALLVEGLGATGETKPRDWTWVSVAGRERLVSMTLSVSRDDFTAHTGYLCVARDVSEQRHSQEMLIAALDKERTAVERLRALDVAKNDFVSTVSHELRTPVTSMVGYIEMLLDGEIVAPHDDQVPLLETVERNGKRLIAMVNDLLMLSELDSETVTMESESVDLAETLRPVEDSVLPMLKGRDLTLVVEQPGMPVRVTGDRAQLERVMINLLSNAIKFSEDGGTVELSVMPEGDEAVIRVRDTGIGIPVDEQAELFQRFFRASTAQRAQIQGTGLGLSIVSAIVEGHGGHVEVESAHLQGSTFTVRLPLAKSERLTHSA